MTTWQELYPGDAILIRRKWFKDPGQFSYSAPAGAKFMRAIARGVGGQGDNWGGSGAYARTSLVVAEDDQFLIQVGKPSTAAIIGDSWVKRIDGSPVCYADRGRGNSNGGLASNSLGDIVSSGAPGGGSTPRGGDAADDTNPISTLGTGGKGYDNTGAGFIRPADFGGGGRLLQAFNESGAFGVFGAYAAGSGVVVLEFFSRDPLI